MINIKELLKNELIQGSIALFIMINIFNVLNFLFHFISGRMLGPADYGILTTLMAIIYILAIPSDTISTVLSRFATKFYVKKDYGSLKALMLKSIKKLLWIGLAGLAFFFILAIPLGNFFELSPALVILLGVIFVGVLLTPILRGVLQGIKSFNYLGVSFFIEGFIKVFFAVILIWLGWNVYGPITAIVLSLFLVFLANFLFKPFKQILSSKTKHTKIKGIYSYSVPVVVAMTFITLFYTIDILLAKKFFGAEIAGLYGAISMIAKIIFFATVPISKALFPLASERNDKQASTKNLAKKALGLVLLLGIIALIFYLAFPKLILWILYGSDYLVLSNLLIYPSIAMTFLALTNLLVFNNLSKHKDKTVYALPVFFIIQLALLILFHATLFQFILMLIIGNAITFLYFLINMFRHEK